VAGQTRPVFREFQAELAIKVKAISASLDGRLEPIKLIN
jgi:hypothetical protein